MNYCGITSLHGGTVYRLAEWGYNFQKTFKLLRWILVTGSESWIRQKKKKEKKNSQDQMHMKCLHWAKGFEQYSAQLAWGYCILLCSLSVLSNKLHKPPTRNLWRCICDDAAAPPWPARSLSIQKPLFQTIFHVLFFFFALNNSYNLCSTKTHVQFLPPAALEASHTCSQSSKAIHSILLLRDLNNIGNSN